MTILDKTLRWIANRLKGYYPGPGGVGFVNRSYTNEAGALPSFESAFAKDPFVYRCLSVIGDTMAAVPLKFYRETFAGGEVQRDELSDHPIVELFWNPGPRASGFQLIRDAAITQPLSGEFFWFVENGTTGESLTPTTIERIQPIRPRFIRNVQLSQAGVVTGYVFNQSGKEKVFAPEFFVHCKNFNPSSDTRGLSAIEVLQSAVLLSMYMEDHNRQFFKSGANPGFILSTPSELSPEARKDLQESWDKQYGGVDKAHKTAVLEGGLTPHPISINAKDGEFIKLHNLSRDQKLTALGVPPVIAGIFEFANYANSSQQMRIFYQHTIIPLGNLIQDAINTQLIPQWFAGDKGLYCEFDYSGITVLQDDHESKARVDQIYVSTGIKTPNEVRLTLNLEPIDGGDELRGGGFGGLTLSGDGLRLTRGGDPPTRLEMWQEKNREFERDEKTLERVMADFFRDQADRVVTALDAVALLAGNVPNNVRAIDPDMLFAIFDPDVEDKAILDAAMPVIRDIMEQAGSSALSSVGSGVQFNIADPRVQAFLAQKEVMVTGLNRVTEKVLRDVLVDATADGYTVSQTSAAIRDLFTDMSNTRATTIARTEVVGANNAAALEGYRQSGVVQKKEWLSTRDGSVRDSHMAVDGEKVSIDGLFSNGLPTPGVDGPPEEVINCRCVVLPVADD